MNDESLPGNISNISEKDEKELMEFARFLIELAYRLKKEDEMEGKA